MMRPLTIFNGIYILGLGVPTTIAGLCDPAWEPMYPHNRRSLSPSTRQVIGLQVIPGQGQLAPPKPPPPVKYIISSASIEPGPMSLNGSQDVVPEVFRMIVANASVGSPTVACEMYWALPMKIPKEGGDPIAYQMNCEDYKFCALLERASPNLAAGFYVFVSQPNQPGTMAAWMVKNLTETVTTPIGWSQIQDPRLPNGTQEWVFDGTADLSAMPEQDLRAFLAN